MLSWSMCHANLKPPNPQNNLLVIQSMSISGIAQLHVTCPAYH